MFFGNSITTMVATLLAVLIAITCHEVAHGFVAYKLGDNTAKEEGRLTLNPLAHLDPVGALMMLIAGFGWAKPVPVNPFFFKGDRVKGMMLVSVAGPVTNLILSFAFYFIFMAGDGFLSLPFLRVFLQYCVRLNVYLAVFNLIPIPPLDGSKILAGFLPRKTAITYLNTVERYGMLILLFLIFFHITDRVMIPVANAILHAYYLVLSVLFL